MGYLGRRIGKSQNNSSSGDGVDGNLGGGILDLFAQGYFAREGNINRTPGAPPSGHVATGGVISDYTAPDGVYRAHIFTSSGTFDITSIGNINSIVEYLVVAGGGGGGAQGAGSGGGGAGGLRTNLPGVQDAGGNPLTGSAFPVSVAIIFAISSFSISMASAIWRSIFPLSLGITFDQDLNAFRDDFTAISTSASLPRGTVANILLFAGHSISIVFSVMLLVYLPSMII